MSETPAGADNRFRSGKIVMTHGALKALVRADANATELLTRHLTGDWGELSDDDARSNEAAIEHEGKPDLQERVLSAYTLTSGVKLWIITEWDRSVTTLLLPEEY